MVPRRGPRLRDPLARLHAQARQLGINAILSSPLAARDRPVGALNIYSRTAGAFGAQDQQLAAVFAAEASTVLTTAGLDVSDDELAERIRQAERARQTIALAQGAIMQRDGIDEDRAYTHLRQLSHKSGRSLRDQAEDVVAATGRAPGDRRRPPGSRDG